MSAALLVSVLREPSAAASLSGDDWTALLTAARAEQLIGSLAHWLDGIAVPPAVARILTDARASAVEQRRAALWEVEMARRALAPLGVPVVLLKGSAFVAAGLAAGVGRSIGDLDILVPKGNLDAVEAALLSHGWEWVKPDPYDDEYYRRWMHELPPLIHRARDRMIDVHHTILPPTARPKPAAASLIAESVPLGNGLSILSPADMIVHAAAHLFADGDLAGGLRNLWDVHRLVEDGVPPDLAAHARHHGLATETERALRLADHLYGSGASLGVLDRLYLRRLLARDGWGRATRPITRLAFYVRSHWLRMPPLLLARHLWTKWRKGSA